MGDSWARSGRRTAAGRSARPAGSWGAAIGRARAAWDELTGGPAVDRDGRRVYSDAAAAAILAAALALWADTAAGMDD